MALINPQQEISDPAVRELAENYRREMGTVGPLLNSFLTLQRRPRLLQAANELSRAAMASYPGSRVSPELKILLAHVSSEAAGFRYCQAHTGFLAHRRGADPERLEKIWEYETSPLFTDTERAALDLARAAGVTPNAVTAEMQETARKYWTEDELVEIVAMIALFGFANRWNDTIATPLEGPAKAYASEHMTAHGWEVGRHQ